jgi:nicotinamide mononucleotide transporter
MNLIYNWIADHFIEFVAFLLGIWGVWLEAKQKALCWPVGLLNIILSIIVFYESRLYADVLLQIFYIIITFFGWYYWLYGGKNKTKLKISKIPLKEFIPLIISALLFGWLIGYLFSKYTNAALPYWDSFSFTGGIIGTYILAKKYIENWMIWIIINVLCTGIYLYKELYFFTIQYFIFIILAVYGYYSWKKDMKKAETEA